MLGWTEWSGGGDGKPAAGDLGGMAMKERYRNVGEYDAVLRAHCRLDAEDGKSGAASCLATRVQAANFRPNTPEIHASPAVCTGGAEVEQKTFPE